jgi:LDH2 family malate/lactate/ureidoglycolate dehydrogenase
MDDLIRLLQDSAEAEGQKRIFILGEREFECEERYRREGIPLYHKVYEDLKAIGGEAGVPLSL